jgi:hypothetical protein
VNPSHAFLAVALSLAAASSAQSVERREGRPGRDPRPRSERVEPQNRPGTGPSEDRDWQEEVRRIVREEVRAALHEAMQRLKAEHPEHGMTDRGRQDGQHGPDGQRHLLPRVQHGRHLFEPMRADVLRLHVEHGNDTKVLRLHGNDVREDVRKIEVRDGKPKKDEKAEKSEKAEGKTRRRALVLGDDEPRLLRVGNSGGNDPVVLELRTIDDVEAAGEDCEECESCESKEQQPGPEKQPRKATPAPLMFRKPTRVAKPRIWV